jgi:hypothetical protein
MLNDGIEKKNQLKKEPKKTNWVNLSCSRLGS